MDIFCKSVISVINKDVDIVKAIRDKTISGQQERPFYICNINDIVKKYTTWVREMPAITPYYAVKCNNHPAALQVLAALGTGFACTSKCEIEQVLSLGVSPARIIFAHPTKISSHISYASKFKVNLMTFDSELELYKMKELCPDVKAVIRIRLPKTTTRDVLDAKFGCDSHDEAPHLLRIAKKIDVNVVGVSFHVGRMCKDPKVFDPAISACKHVFNVAKNLDFKFRLIDIGGGFMGKNNNSIDQFAAVINLALKKYFSTDSVDIISEPGTYFVESSFALACNVHSVRQLDTVDQLTRKKSTKFMYYLNDGIFGSFSTVISMGVMRIPITLKETSTRENFLSTLWGVTVDQFDIIANNIYLPKMECGEWLFFSNMGSYTLCFESSYNSFENPDVYHIIDTENCLLLENKLHFIEEKKYKISNFDSYTEIADKNRKGIYGLQQNNINNKIYLEDI